MSAINPTPRTTTEKAHEILVTSSFSYYWVVFLGVPACAFAVFLFVKTEPGQRLLHSFRIHVRHLSLLLNGHLKKKTVDVLWQSPNGPGDRHAQLVIKEIELLGGLELRPRELSSDGREQRSYPNLPILVIANSVTRLAIDVDHALTNIEPSKRVAVMIVHNVAPHVQHQLPDSHMMLCRAGSQYSQLGLIVDIIVHDGRLSQCNKNTRSIDDIVKFIGP